MAYTKYSLTPSSNTAAPPDGAPEGMLPSAVNDTMRDMMAQIRDCGDGIRDGTYTMTAPKITGGTITGAAFTGNTFTSPVISGGTINNATIGATTATTGKFTTLEATGVATFSAGAVGTPAITTTGDTNTGIFFPAADTIAFAQGGVQSMRITSAGNVGIGISTPASNLHINETDISGTDVDIVRFSTASGGVINFVCSDLSSSTPTWTLQTGTSEPLAFKQGTSERMRIDSSGNVGIGTSSPSGRLQVETSGSAASLFVRSDISTSALASRVLLGNSVGTARLTMGLLGGGGEVGFFGSEGSFPIYFQTNGTERMRITSGGDVIVGDTGSIVTSGRFRVLQTSTSGDYISRLQSNAASGPVGVSVYYSGSSPNGTGNVFLICEDSTTTRMTVRSNGGIANYSANDVNLSDAREKTNIELAGSYLNKICSIPVKTFNYIDQNLEEDDGLTLGVIAQDVQAVAPELVMESNWASKDEPEKMRLSIYQTDLQYALMKSIQELKAELDSVKAELQTLKGN